VRSQLNARTLAGCDSHFERRDVAQTASSSSRGHWGFVWYTIIVIAWITDAILRGRFGRYNPSRDAFTYSSLEWRVLACVWLVAATMLVAIAVWRPSRDPAHRFVERWGPPLLLFAAAVDWLESLLLHTWTWSIPIAVAYAIVILWKAKRLRLKWFSSSGG
jgi:hypothetical protein